MQRRFRGLATAALATVTLLVAACGGGAGSPSGGGTAGKEGGTISLRGCTPENPLIAATTTEMCGGTPLDAITAKLVRYDPKTAAPSNDIAESIKTTDNQNFTITLKKGYKFADGTEIKAKNFVDAWNIAAYGPNGYGAAYFLEPIKGYADLQCPDAKCTTPPPSKQMSGLTIVDDYTFTMQTTAPVANMAVRLGYMAFAPQPDAYLTEYASNPKTPTFGKAPIGSGPYTITSSNETQIVLEKNPHYSGAFPGHVDKIIYRIYNDTPAAYADALANNLDLDDSVPTDQLANDAWKAQFPNRNLLQPIGAINYLAFEGVDTAWSNNTLRKAIGEAIDRDTITKQVFSGSRIPANSWTAPGMDGYLANTCGDACSFDPTKAKADYQAGGGYPGTLFININGDGGHQQWAQAVCNDLKNNLGVDCQLNILPDFRTLLTKERAGELKGLTRGNWVMDYPSIQDFLEPLYATGGSSNRIKYSNAAFDQQLKTANAQTDLAAADADWQKAEKMLADNLPSIPLWYSAEAVVWSQNVTNVSINTLGEIDLAAVQLK